MGRHSARKDKGDRMTRDERHRWLFAKMDGRRITFDQEGMPFRVMRSDAVFGGVAFLDGNRCRIRIVHKQNEEKGKRYEVRFPDKEWKRIGTGVEGEPIWSRDVPLEETTLVGYMEMTGYWKNGTGKCLFHPIGEST